MTKVLNQEDVRHPDFSVWHEVAFYNYIQSFVERGERPTRQQWEEAQAPWQVVLKYLQPDAVLVASWTAGLRIRRNHQGLLDPDRLVVVAHPRAGGQWTIRSRIKFFRELVDRVSRAKVLPRRGNQPPEERDYGDGLVLVRVDTTRRVPRPRYLRIDQLFEGNRRADTLRDFFQRLHREQPITVARLQQILEEAGHEHAPATVRVIKKRLTYFSNGRYDRDNWHIFLQPEGEQPSPDDIVKFCQIKPDGDEEDG